MQASKKIVAVGGGHCNCQVLKLLKQLLPTVNEPTSITLINEAPASYYSGMLPGSVSKLYSDTDLTIDMAPLASWCGAEYIEKRVSKVHANENRLELDDGSFVDYDILALNVGSKTRGAKDTTGVWEHSLTTRPINELLPKIQRKEQELLTSGVVPSVVVCGAGAAGVELAFAFKHRWAKVFGQEIDVSIVASGGSILTGADPCAIEMTTRKLEEHKIPVHYNNTVAAIDETGVHLKSGLHLACTVPVWATGAAAQPVTGGSDLAIQNGYFQVNDYMQSTSHPNVFAGGDCVTLQTYADKGENFPPKAGVYAVREGPFIAQNIVKYLKGEEMSPYIPQRSFLSLMITGDGKAIGTKFGMAWSGKWVWKMKDYIDMSFMNLFMASKLYRDFETEGTKYPIENAELFDEESKEEQNAISGIRERVETLDADQAAQLFICDEETEDFFERLFMIQRMNADDSFADEVMVRHAHHTNRQ